jgi:hypothetical protein
MPLSRLNDGFEIELEGIAFGMVDRQGHRWRCLITDRVLSDAIGGAPTQKDKTTWFRANRSSVERVASNKFDMGAFEKDGSSALPIGGAAVDRLLYYELVAAVDHSRETGSIAAACLARSLSPLSPTTQSRANGDFPSSCEKPRIRGARCRVWSLRRPP